MNKPTPPNLGNLLFNYSDPSQIQLHREALAIARDEGPYLDTMNPSWTEPNHMISAIETGEFYKSLRERVEEDLATLVEKYSPDAWLWYLRRLPLFFFDFDNSIGSAYATSDLAEVISGLHRSKRASTPSSLDPLTFELDGHGVVDLIQFCGKVHLLRRIHQRIRTAGKEVAFQSINGRLPKSRPTDSQLEALRRYEAPPYGYRFLIRTGTPLMVNSITIDAIMIVGKDFAGRWRVSIEAWNDDFAEQFPLANRVTKTNDHVNIPTKFDLYEVELPDLPQFSIEHLDGPARSDAARVIMLLWLARQMVIEVNPIYGRLQVAQTGYIIENVNTFSDRISTSFDQMRSIALRYLPQAELPASSGELLTLLESAYGSSWPLTHGPVIRRTEESLMIDVYAASRRLEDQLAFKKLEGAPANDRAFHFEDQVQQLIDGTQWGKSLPDELRSLRKRKSLKRADGSALTDVDAIGANADTLLLVSCKSVLVTDDSFLGTHRVARNNAKHIEQSVRKGRSDSAYLQAYPVLSGSYDLSAYRNIVVVVCTPGRIYVELEMVRKAGLDVSELECIKEVLPGLPVAVSFVELVDWLGDPV